MSSTDSESEAREVRREEAAEAMLGCLLPGSRLTQCSHSDELVEPAGTSMHTSAAAVHRSPAAQGPGHYCTALFSTPEPGAGHYCTALLPTLEPRVQCYCTALLCSLHLSPELALMAPAPRHYQGNGALLLWRIHGQNKKTELHLCQCAVNASM